MLTSDLLSVRISRGTVVPRYLDAESAENRDLAASMIAVFEAAVGRPRHELDSELGELLGTGTAFLLHRGLAKLLHDRCEVETRAEVEPPELRRGLFAAAAEAYRAGGAGDTSQERETLPDREALVAAVAERFEITPAEVEQALYADLKDQQVVESLKPCSAEWLLKRYNTALAQAVLLRAHEVTIEISGLTPSRYRALFRKVKFHQLLHTIVGDAARGYRIRLDGPLSLFKASQRYGLQLALFLPTLLHFEGWKLTAALLWGKRRLPKRFVLTPEEGLRPHTRLTGQWQPEELAWFPKRFAKIDCGWEVSTEAEIVDLGGRGVLVPDFVFHHQASGTRALMEVFGFWNKGAVASRLALLAEHGPPNLVLALSRSLAGEEADPEEIGAAGDTSRTHAFCTYAFRTTPIPRQVAKLLEGFL